jgi:hypothetical protein
MITRKEFLLAAAAMAGAADAMTSEPARPPRVLLVVAHPDDENWGGTVD